MRVTFFQRRPQEGNFSLERLFNDVRAAMPSDIDVTTAVSRFASRGLWRRVYNVIEAVFRQGDVNHIAGDVHFLAMLLRKARTILTIPDLRSARRLGGIKGRLFLFFWCWLPIRRSAVVTVISQATKDELLRYVHVTPRNIRVIHCCVSNQFQPFPKPFDGVRPVVLQVGVGQNKNLERVARAIQGVPCHLRIIGKLNERQTALLHACGIVYSAAAGVSDAQVVDEYRKCDMLVFASTYEGFGLPIVEAQATGRPVVTSNIYSMPEVAGDGACLVDPFDPESIREGILRVIQDEAYRNVLVRRGYRNVERFRPEVIAAQYCKLYEELAGEAVAGDVPAKRAA